MIVPGTRRRARAATAPLPADAARRAATRSAPDARLDLDLHRRLRAGRRRAARRAAGHHALGLRRATSARLYPPGAARRRRALRRRRRRADLGGRRRRRRPVPARRAPRPRQPRSPTASARHCVVPPWRDGGQAQFIDRPVPEPRRRRRPRRPGRGRWTASSRADRPRRRWPAHARMSVRTFTRRFREETGQSPAPGSPSSGSGTPGTCWRPPTCRSTRSPPAPASAPPRRCASTSGHTSASRRRPTGARSGAPDPGVVQ